MFGQLKNTIGWFGNGGEPGSSGSWNPITHSALDTLIRANTVTPGAWYLITDRGDQGILVLGLTINTVSTEGIRFMNVPATYTVAVVAGVTWKGVYNITVGTPYNINDTVIWGGLAWTNTTGTNAELPIDNFTLNPLEWDLQAKPAYGSSNAYYATKQYGVNYDFANDWINQQWDNLGNVFGIDYITSGGALANNPVDYSDWNMETLGYFYNNRARSVFNNNVQKIFNNTAGGDIFNNVVYSEISNNRVTVDISENIIDSYIRNNNINGSISINANPGDIENNVYNYDITGLLSSHLNLSNNQLTNTFGAYSMSITSLTTLNLTAFSKYLIKVLLTSTNATENITVITNLTTQHPVSIEVESGLEVTFVHGAGATNPKCEGGLNAVIDGTKGDFIQFENYTIISSGTVVLRQTEIGTY